jgi:hypothetical protein
VLVGVNEKRLLECGLANLEIACEGDQLVAGSVRLDDFEG